MLEDDKCYRKNRAGKRKLEGWVGRKVLTLNRIVWVGLVEKLIRGQSRKK